jgi:hypothetical protein
MLQIQPCLASHSALLRLPMQYGVLAQGWTVLLLGGLVREGWACWSCWGGVGLGKQNLRFIATSTCCSLPRLHCCFSLVTGRFTHFSVFSLPSPSSPSSVARRFACSPPPPPPAALRARLHPHRTSQERFRARSQARCHSHHVLTQVSRGGVVRLCVCVCVCACACTCMYACDSVRVGLFVPRQSRAPGACADASVSVPCAYVHTIISAPCTQARAGKPCHIVRTSSGCSRALLRCKTALGFSLEG